MIRQAEDTKMRQAMEYNNTDDERTISSCDLNSSKSNRRPSRQRREPVNIITSPNPNDILCGKEKHCIIHPGTRRYRQFIDAYQPRYRCATNKNDKMEITKEIVLTLGRTARFLRYNKEIEAYEELSHLESRDKTSHALRTACKRISKQQKHKVTKPIQLLADAATDTTPVPPLIPSNVASASISPLQWRRQRSVPLSEEQLRPLPVHSNEKMDGALFDDFLSIWKGGTKKE